MMHISWISVHLFYHSDLDRVLTAWTYPLIIDLQEQQLLDRFFFIRYWQGGPHIRLRLLPRGNADPAAIRTIVNTHADQFIAAHTAADVLSLERYLQMTAQFTQWEYGEDRRLPFYANNSLHEIPYEPEEQRYGGQAALARVEQHFMDSSAIILELLIRGSSRQQRIGRALATMLLALAQWSKDPAVLQAFFHFSYQRWAPAIGADEASLGAAFEQHYRRQRSHVLPLVLQLLESDTTQDDWDASLIEGWTASVRTLRDALRRLARSGDLHIRVPTRLRELSTLPKADIGAMRIMLECLHMHHNRLGVSIQEEVALAFLLQRALAEILGALSNSQVGVPR